MYDVVIVGYGPTGMLAAIQLGRAGHRVAVIERHMSLYQLPRAGMVHDDVLRMFQEIEIGARVQPATYFVPTYEMGAHGRVLLSNEVLPLATHGWPEFLSIFQPAFEVELDAAVKRLPNVEVVRGFKATALSQTCEDIEVTAEDETGARRTWRGRYLIGADGGNSFTREALGIGFDHLGFDQDWLVVDARIKRPRPDIPGLRQFCEPEQPGMTIQMGPNHRRWSFMVFPDESPADAVKPENVWRRLDRLEGGTSDDFELVRVVVYNFRSDIANRWRAGRAFLIGDAAHLMPPFLGQGLCTGFRDGFNLTWKLDLVLRGKAGPEFLDSYAAEREPNARATVMESMRVGQTVIIRDPEKAKARDAQLVAMQEAKAQANAGGSKELIAFRVPGYQAGFRASAGVAAGDVFPQARVSKDGREGLFDDVVGRGFLIIGRNGDPSAALSADERAFWTALGGRVGQFGEGAGRVQDIEGQYTRLMDEYGCDVLVKRPDYYLFGACKSARDLPALIADLRAQLQH
jgi:2-polyprenyl-6-methoxyphenol hydroxylase-like FAD-dependent oxidoreductase